MNSLHPVRINIKYEVKDLVKTVDFYNILLGKWAADLYPKHAVYTIKSLMLTLTFIQNPKTVQPVCGAFNLLLDSDEEVYERYYSFAKNHFSNTLTIDPNTFTPANHAFTIKDPNGITWELGVIDKKFNSPKIFNIPRVNSVWDILKPL